MRGDVQEHRVARLHVAGAAAVEARRRRGGWAGCRRSARCRGGRRAARGAPGRGGCGRGRRRRTARDLQLRQLPQRRLHGVGERPLVARDAGDVDQGGGERDGVGGEVEGGRGGHSGHGAGATARPLAAATPRAAAGLAHSARCHGPRTSRGLRRARVPRRRAVERRASARVARPAPTGGRRRQPRAAPPRPPTCPGPRCVPTARRRYTDDDLRRARAAARSSRPAGRLRAVHGAADRPRAGTRWPCGPPSRSFRGCRGATSGRRPPRPPRLGHRCSPRDRASGGRRGRRLHLHTLPGRRTCRVDGMPVTAPRGPGRHGAGVPFDRASSSRTPRSRPGSIRHCATAVERAGRRPGNARAAGGGFADGGGQSVGESRSRILLARHDPSGSAVAVGDPRAVTRTTTSAGPSCARRRVRRPVKYGRLLRPGRPRRRRRRREAARRPRAGRGTRGRWTGTSRPRRRAPGAFARRRTCALIRAARVRRFAAPPRGVAVAPPDTVDAREHPAQRAGRRHGLATVTPDGTVLDTWYPAPVLDATPRRPRAGEAGRRGRRPRGAHDGRADADRVAGRGARRRRGRLPAPAPAQPPAGAPARDQPRRGVRAARERRMDERRAVRGRRVRDRARAAAGSRAGDRVRRRQVPADGRLRAAVRRADRGRRPGAAGRAPGRGHDGDARGVLQLQRRHARGVDGGGPDLRRRRARRRLGPRGRRLGDGDALGWRQGGHQRRAAAA